MNSPLRTDISNSSDEDSFDKRQCTSLWIVHFQERGSFVNYTAKNRNEGIDFFRGIAMLLVIMGHTISSSTANYQGSFLFNFIWSLQMPLFMIISGYVTRYSKKISDSSQLLNFLKKRTVAYLFPWLCWTVLIRGIVFNNEHMLNPSYLLWHMDSGYWFLTSLWTICILWGFGQFCSSKINKNKNPFVDTVLTIIFTCCFSFVLVAIARFCGINFCGIKLSLYYIPFYLSGYLYSRLEEFVGEKSFWFNKTVEISMSVSALAYFTLLNRFNIAALDENIMQILIRMAASITGCIMIFGFGTVLIHRLKENNTWLPVFKTFNWIGIHSLELYLIHGLVLAPAKIVPFPDIHTLRGVAYFIINTAITFSVSSVLITAIFQSKIARKILFAK